MLIKLIGAAALVGGCFAAGKSGADKLAYRVQVLMGLEEALLIFEGELLYMMSDIKDAFSAASVCDISGVFQKSAVSTERLGAVKAFRAGILSAELEKEETAALTAFASGLNSPDVEGQVKNAALCRERIKAILKIAKEKKERCSKLYTASGFFTGAAIAILLF
ncbi:MAG: stage III sporulation protein AB [Clostridia bacterium]|nr:stage III sporulation protein AB [Clostridia bacterium]